MNSEHIQRIVEIDNRLTDIFKTHYRCTGDEQETSPDKVGYMAWALLAVDVSVRLANVFLAIKNPKEHRTYRAICDLSYQLNTNEFWQKNASVILPAVHVALNSYRDGVDFELRRREIGEYSTYDNLIAASRCAPLEIFPLIAYLVGGPALMQSESVPLKLALAPYFTD